MATIQFSNPKTAAGYEALTEHDQFLDVPAQKGKGTCYRGLLSNITPEGAERYISYKGNLIQKKAGSASGLAAGSTGTKPGGSTETK
jgi:hypothetical protein